LRRGLPEHAISGFFVLMEQLPLTAHGKIDRHKLTLMSTSETRAAVGGGLAKGVPSGETEELIAALWGRALDREDFGREEDFFELGGDSLGDETGDRELIFGIYVTTRRRPETLGMFGCFTQAAAVCLSAPDDVTVRAWFGDVRAAVLAVNDHTELPYDALIEELAVRRHDLRPGAGAELHRALPAAGRGAVWRSRQAAA
jgi:hypothetical protein